MICFTFELNFGTRFLLQYIFGGFKKNTRCHRNKKGTNENTKFPRMKDFFSFSLGLELEGILIQVLCLSQNNSGSTLQFLNKKKIESLNLNKNNG